MRIGIDVDDVVLDLLDEWCWRIRNNNRHAPQLWPEDLTCWEIWQDFGLEESEVFRHLTPDIYKDVNAFSNVGDVLDAIEALGHHVVFVTSCGSVEMYEAKVVCLARHGLLKDRDVIPVGEWAGNKTKATVPVEWLVDDHVGNVEGFPGYALLLTRPHNQRLSTVRKRIKKFGDVVGELESVSKPYPDAQEAAVIHALQPGAIIEVDTPKRAFTLPTDRQARKNIPIMTGVLDYFSAALAEVAEVSMAGNKQHFTNEPLHWQRGLSGDHVDAMVRHGMERGTRDTDGRRHMAKAAWRALAELQEECERDGAPMSRASRPAA